MQSNKTGFFKNPKAIPAGYQDLLQRCSDCLAASKYDEAYQYVSLALYLIDSQTQINPLIQIDSNAHIKGLLKLGLIASRLKQRQQAITAYSDVIALAQKFEQQISLKQNIEACATFKNRLSAIQQEILTERGICYRKEGKYELALADFNQSLAINPNDTKALFNRMIVYFLLNKYQKALVDIEQILVKQPNNINIYWLKAATLNLQNEYAAALTVVNKALNINPDNTEILLEAAKSYLGLEQPTDAQQVIKYICEKDPSYEIPAWIIEALDEQLNLSTFAMCRI